MSYVIAAEVLSSAATHEASSLGYPYHNTRYSVLPYNIVISVCNICHITFYHVTTLRSLDETILSTRKQYLATHHTWN